MGVVPIGPCFLGRSGIGWLPRKLSRVDVLPGRSSFSPVEATKAMPVDFLNRPTPSDRRALADSARRGEASHLPTRAGEAILS